MSSAGGRAGAHGSSSRGSCSADPRSRAQSVRSWAFQFCSRLLNQRGTEIAHGLLAAKRRHVLPEDVERLGAQRGARAGSRLRSRAPELRQRRRPAAATASSISAPTRPPRRQSRSPCRVPASNSSPERIACRASLSPTERARRRFEAPGRIPSLRAGQVEPGAARRDHVVDGVQNLAGAADRERFDRRDPELLGRLLGLGGTMLVRAQAAEELVHVAEVARDEEEDSRGGRGRGA